MSGCILFFDLKESEKNILKEFNLDGKEILFFKENLNLNTVKLLSEDLRKKTEAISVFITSELTEDVINQFENLKLIATRSTGINHIDLETCKNRSIEVKNVKSYGGKAVAQFTFALILSLVRKVIPAFEDVKRHVINISSYEGRNLNNLVLGVVSTGEIGKCVCELACAFGMKVLAYDIEHKEELKSLENFEYVSFENLIKNSDIITIHSPFVSDNYHLFGAKEFEKMKENSYLINTSRGELVDINALYQAMLLNEIKGCALDVVECENISFFDTNTLKKLKDSTKKCLEKSIVLQKMAELPNVIITPHIAYNTKDAIEEILEVTMQNLGI